MDSPTVDTDPIMAQLVQRNEVSVMLLSCADIQDQITLVWEQLENSTGLRGRKFFGIFDPLAHEYSACAQVKADDNPAALGLAVATIPGGTYLKTQIQGEPPVLYQEIIPAIAKLKLLGKADDTRPTIEFYRRSNEIDLFLPILTPYSSSRQKPPIPHRPSRQNQSV